VPMSEPGNEDPEAEPEESATARPPTLPGCAPQPNQQGCRRATASEAWERSRQYHVPYVPIVAGEALPPLDPLPPRPPAPPAYAPFASSDFYFLAFPGIDIWLPCSVALVPLIARPARWPDSQARALGPGRPRRSHHDDVRLLPAPDVWVSAASPLPLPPVRRLHG
jgi:hypothetical protein